METTQQNATPNPAQNAAIAYDDGIKFFRGLGWGLLFAVPAWGFVVGGIALGLHALGIWR